MAMQSLLSIMEASDRQGLEVLERNKMGPSPLGAVGNLRFSAEQGVRRMPPGAAGSGRPQLMRPAPWHWLSPARPIKRGYST